MEKHAIDWNTRFIWGGIVLAVVVPGLLSAVLQRFHGVHIPMVLIALSGPFLLFGGAILGDRAYKHFRS